MFGCFDLLRPPPGLGGIGGRCSGVQVQGRHTLGQAVRAKGIGKFLQGISRVEFWSSDSDWVHLQGYHTGSPRRLHQYDMEYFFDSMFFSFLFSLGPLGNRLCDGFRTCVWGWGGEGGSLGPEVLGRLETAS